jgi:hypothetical protein
VKLDNRWLILLIHKNIFLDNWNQFPEKQDSDGWVEWEYKHYRENQSFFSEEFFENIDEGLNKLNYRSRENEFLLSGILFADDGSKYAGEAAKSGQHMYYYNRKIKKRFPVDHIHKLVFSRLKKLIENSGLLDNVIAKVEAHNELGLPKFKTERIRLEGEIRRLQAVVDNFSEALRSSVLEKKDNLTEIIDTLLVEKDKTSQDIQFLNKQLAKSLGRIKRIFSTFTKYKSSRF